MKEVTNVNNISEATGREGRHRLRDGADETKRGATLGPAKRARVLVVDDDPALCRMLQAVLAEASVDCEFVLNPLEAVEQSRNEEFDAIISDLNMPGMSGMELLARVRRAHPRCGFVMMTGTEDLQIAVQAMRSGADDYLVKPLQADAILASLERCLAKKGLERELDDYRLKLESIVRDRTVQLRTALRQTERSYEETLEALGAAIDLRDNETAGHSRRVCLYSLEIAERLRRPRTELVALARGAWLHDIGKLAIPDAILRKPGPLTQEERATMQTHVPIGYDMVSRISFLADAAAVVRTHHERHDGKGYVQGLKGDDIPCNARIFAVADAFDAITSDRPYRAAQEISVAQKQIHAQSGTQFDPWVVEAFLAVSAQEWMTLRVQSQRPGVPSDLLGLPVSQELSEQRVRPG